jgi:hypothetical protein
MKNSIEDMVKETIEETPLGGKSLSSILENNSLDQPAKGLASLLSNDTGKPVTQTKTQVQQITTEFYPTDTAINNEFLRLEREKNEKLTRTLENLGSLPDQIETLQKKLDDLTNFEEMNKLDHDIKEEITTNRFDLIKEKRNYLYVVMAICLAFGMVLGPVVFTNHKEKVVIAPPKKIIKTIKKIKRLDQFVTLKFVNIRELNSPKSPIVMTLSPNQVLTQIDKKGGWIKIEYKDLVKGKTIKGWSWYENLKAIKTP